jgi:hypothetical protein
MAARRTGPVRVLLDLVLHVPTISLGQVPWAAVRAARPARPAREYFMVGGAVVRIVRAIRVVDSGLLSVCEGGNLGSVGRGKRHGVGVAMLVSK